MEVYKKIIVGWLPLTLSGVSNEPKANLFLKIHKNVEGVVQYCCT